MFLKCVEVQVTWSYSIRKTHHFLTNGVLFSVQPTGATTSSHETVAAGGVHVLALSNKHLTVNEYVGPQREAAQVTYSLRYLHVTLLAG